MPGTRGDFWETRALQPCHVRVQAGSAPVKPAAPPVVAPCRAPILPVALAGAVAHRPRWIAQRERFFLGPFQGVLQSLSALIQLAGISSTARCAALGAALGARRGWQWPGEFCAGIQEATGAGQPHFGHCCSPAGLPGCRRGCGPSPILAAVSSSPPSPAVPLVQLAPQNLSLRVSQGCCTCQS